MNLRIYTAQVFHELLYQHGILVAIKGKLEIKWHARYSENRGFRGVNVIKEIVNNIFKDAKRVTIRCKKVPEEINLIVEENKISREMESPMNESPDSINFKFLKNITIIART